MNIGKLLNTKLGELLKMTKNLFVNGVSISVSNKDSVVISSGRVTINGKEVSGIDVSGKSYNIKAEDFAISIKTDKDVNVSGSVAGDIEANNVNCDNVAGDVSAKGSVACHNVVGDIYSESHVDIKGIFVGNVKKRKW